MRQEATTQSMPLHFGALASTNEPTLAQEQIQGGLIFQLHLDSALKSQNVLEREAQVQIQNGNDRLEKQRQRFFRRRILCLPSSLCLPGDKDPSYFLTSL